MFRTSGRPPPEGETLRDTTLESLTSAYGFVAGCGVREPIHAPQSQYYGSTGTVTPFDTFLSDPIRGANGSFMI